MRNLYVLRHGETIDNARSIIQGPRIDGDLSETGWQQAEHLGRAFRETPLDAVLVSPMRRARQTAQALIAGTGHSLQTVPELYEMDFGDLCGQHVTDAQPILERLAEAWNMGLLGQSFPGGESPLLVQHRLRGLIQRLQSDPASDVAVVAHGRLNRVLIASLLGWDLRRMDELPQSNAAITHLVCQEGGLHLRRLNDTAHLAS